MPDGDFNPWEWLQSMFPQAPSQPSGGGGSGGEGVPQWMVNECNNLKWYEGHTVKSNLQRLESNTDNILGLLGKDYLTSSDLVGYAKLSDIPNVSKFITSTDLSNVLSSYALKSDIPSVPDAKSIESLIASDILIRGTDINGSIRQFLDNVNVAFKKDIPDVTPFVTRSELTDALSSYAPASELSADFNSLSNQISSLDTRVSSLEVDLGPYPVKVGNTSYSLSTWLRTLNMDYSTLQSAVNSIDTMSPAELSAYLGFSAYEGISPLTYNGKALNEWINDVSADSQHLNRLTHQLQSLSTYIGGMKTPNTEFNNDLKSVINLFGVAYKSDIPTGVEIEDIIGGKQWGTITNVKLDDFADGIWPHKQAIESLSSKVNMIDTLLDTSPQNVPESLLVKFVSPFDGKVFDSADDYYKYLQTQAINDDTTIYVENFVKDLKASGEYEIVYDDGNSDTYSFSDVGYLSGSPQYWDFITYINNNYGGGSSNIKSITLKWYRVEPDLYSGETTLGDIKQTLSNFVSDQTPLLSNIRPYPPAYTNKSSMWSYGLNSCSFASGLINEATSNDGSKTVYLNCTQSNDDRYGEISDLKNYSDIISDTYYRGYSLLSSDEVSNELSLEYRPKLMAIDGTVFSADTTEDYVRNYSLNLLNSLVGYNGQSFAPRWHIIDYLTAPQGIATIYSLKDYEEDNRKRIDSIEMTLQSIESAVEYAIDPSELQQALNARLQSYATIDYTNTSVSNALNQIGFDPITGKFTNPEMFDPTVYNEVGKRVLEDGDSIHDNIVALVSSLSVESQISGLHAKDLNSDLPDVTLGDYLGGVYKQVGWNEESIDYMGAHFDVIKAQMENMKGDLLDELVSISQSVGYVRTANLNLPNTPISLPNIDLGINDLRSKISNIETNINGIGTYMSTIGTEIDNLSDKLLSIGAKSVDTADNVYNFFNTTIHYHWDATLARGSLDVYWGVMDAINWILSIDTIDKFTWRETISAFSIISQLSQQYLVPIINDLKDFINDVHDAFQDSNVSISDLKNALDSVKGILNDNKDLLNDIVDKLSSVENKINSDAQAIMGTHNSLTAFSNTLGNMPVITIPTDDTFLKDVNLDSISMKLPDKPNIDFSF